MTWWQSATKPLRWARWAAANWSTSSDQAFHEALFSAAEYDPFTFSYPGYLTIRRFADLAESKISDAATVLDLGCGPGEITCELARRNPDRHFIGIDHSPTAIRRAMQHAERLRLRNVDFKTGNLETFYPEASVGAVLMFDAFHHLLAPASFVRRLKDHTSRFFLVEPAGSWTGSWDRSFDLDWLPQSVLRIRDRLEHHLGVVPRFGCVNQAPGPSSVGQPTERRYTVADIEDFFAPWPVEIVGTIAGLQEYGPSPFASSDVRDKVGEVAFHLIANLEAALRDLNLDLAAKHWAIYAAADAVPRRLKRPAPRMSAVGVPVQGPYDAEYRDYHGPTTVFVDQNFTASLDVTNKGWHTWDSTEENPFNVSYRWLTQTGEAIPVNSLRTKLPGAIPPGGNRSIEVSVQAPSTPDRFTLAIELVREGITWFSEVGVSPLRVPIRVIRRKN